MLLIWSWDECLGDFKAFSWGWGVEQYLHGSPLTEKVDNNIFEVIEGVHLVLGEFSLSAGTFLSHWGWVKVGWVVRWMGACKSTQLRACFPFLFLKSDGGFS